jgi:hypothetical protein
MGVNEHLNGAPSYLYVLQGASEGFSLDFNSPSPIGPPDLRVKNSQTCLRHAEQVSAIIESEIQLGRIVGPFQNPPFPNCLLHPLHVVQKPSGGIRLLHNLSAPAGRSLNDGVSAKAATVVYTTVEQAVDHIVRLELTGGGPASLAKVDIKDAYRNLPVCPSQFPLLVFRQGELFYHDAALAMGARNACKVFSSVSAAIAWVISNKFSDVAILSYIDDFLAISPSPRRTQEALDALKELCGNLNLPLNEAKTVQPTHTLTFLGVVIDTANKELRLPREKLDRLVVEARALLSQTKATLVQLQSFLGLLSWAVRAVLPGRMFARRLAQLTTGLKRPSDRVRITWAVREDLQVWLSFFSKHNGRSFFLAPGRAPHPHIRFSADAAGRAGFGLVCGTEWTFGSFTWEWEDIHITSKELFPILVFVEIFSLALQNRRIEVFSDNTAVVGILNTQTARDPHCLLLLRRIVLRSLQLNCVIMATHLPGKLNTLADALSRGKIELFREMHPGAASDPTPLPLSVSPNRWLL